MAKLKPDLTIKDFPHKRENIQLNRFNIEDHIIN